MPPALEQPAVLGCYSLGVNAGSFYRLISPFSTLRDYGHSYDWLPTGDIEAADTSDSQLTSSGGSRKRYDVVTLYSPKVVAVEEFHARGAICGGDMDDDIWSLDDSNPVKQGLDPGEAELVAATLARLDFITVTTPHLAKRLVEVAGVDPDKLYVIPNAIDFSMFDNTRWQLAPTGGGEDGRQPAVTSMREVRRKRLNSTTDRPLIIGLQGGPAHIEDWQQIGPALRDTARYYGERVAFVVAGFHPDYLREALHTADAAGRVCWQDWIPITRHAETVMRFDINLCPLLPTLFNRSKSNLKWLEASAAGAASVVSPTVYGEYVTAGHDALIAHTPDDWARAISYLIENRPVRQAIARRAHSLVRSRYNLQAGAAYTWHDTYLRALHAAGKRVALSR